MTDTFVWERCDAGGGSCVDVDTQTVPEGTIASRVLVAGDVGSTIRVRGYRNAVLIGETGPVGPVTATGTFFLTPDDLRLLTPDVEFTGGTAADFQAFLDSLDGVNKKLGGIAWGVSVDRGLSSNWRLTHKGLSVANPIRLFPTRIPTIYTPGGEPLIKGRWVFYSTAGNTEVSWLKLDGEHDPTGNTSSWSVGAGGVTFDRVRAFQSNPTTHGTIGFSPIAGSFGNGDNFILRYSKIHDIGQKPVTSTSSPGFFMHGLYSQALNANVHDVWVWNCSRNGLLFRGAKNSVYSQFASDRNGCAAEFGDNGSASDRIHHAIVTNSFEALHNDDWGIGIFSPGPGNSFDHVGSFGNFKGDFDTDPNVANNGSNITGTDPAYVHRVDADPALVDLRPTAGAYIAAGLGATHMIPF